MGHDPAAALINGQGAIVAAIEEGKLGRTRSFGDPTGSDPVLSGGGKNPLAGRRAGCGGQRT